MTWTRDKIDHLLRTNDRAVERAILAIWRRQTSDEQRAGDTKHNNGVGFCSWSAKKGSYYARWIQGGRHLSGWHLQNARRIALHHSGQLVEEAAAR